MVSFYSQSSHWLYLPSVVPPIPPVETVCSSQIKFFDVYYTYEPVVGIHVLGFEYPSSPISVQATVNFGEVALLSLQVTCE